MNLRSVLYFKHDLIIILWKRKKKHKEKKKKMLTQFDKAIKLFFWSIQESTKPAARSDRYSYQNN